MTVTDVRPPVEITGGFTGGPSARDDVHSIKGFRSAVKAEPAVART